MSCENLHSLPPCVLHEDEHLLVVNKPAGINTHAPSPYAGEGIYDWLKNREARWASLAIIHRLDKETSGVMVFGKTPLANRALTEQFAGRAVRKKYVLLTDRRPGQREFTAKSKIVRVGERYASGVRGEPAETRFKVLDSPRRAPHLTHFEAEPLTGRTHQIRVHAAENGLPILGDQLYGGSPFPRICLHAAGLSFKHPASGEPLTFDVSAEFTEDARLTLRAALIEPDLTSAFRIFHGASDGWPGLYLDRLGDFLLAQSERPLSDRQTEFLNTAMANTARGMHPIPRSRDTTGVYHKVLTRQVRLASVADTSPRLVSGEPAPERFTIRENGVHFELSFNEGYSVGLFLDQRDNRRRFLTAHVAAGFPLLKSEFQSARPEILNAFAYTCGFSVCVALAGATTTSLDLSKKYLEWGRRNFKLNGLDPAAHDFIYGDAFDWLRRLAKKGRAFDVVVLDPPTFSQSKEHGVFRAEKNYGKLVAQALPLVKTGGVLFVSTNAADWPAEKFLASVTAPIRNARRKILQQHYAPQPPDFPISRAETGYLKTSWLRVA